MIGHSTGWQVLVDLGDEQAKVRRDLAGANSPYTIVNHCLGVVRRADAEVVADVVGRSTLLERRQVCAFDAAVKEQGSGPSALVGSRPAREGGRAADDDPQPLGDTL